MAVAPTLGNGRVFATLLSDGRVQDFYSTQQGRVQSCTIGTATQQAIGVLIDDTITWLGDEGWTTHQFTAQSAVMCHTRATHYNLEVEIAISSAIDTKHDALLRHVSVTNLAHDTRRITVLFQQAYTLGDSMFTDDTAQYSPALQGIVQYNGNATLITGARHRHAFFDACHIGLRNPATRDDTCRAMQHGQHTALATGAVESYGSYTLRLDTHEAATIDYWTVCADSYSKAHKSHRELSHGALTTRFAHITATWRQWLHTAQQTVYKWPSPVQADFLQAFLPAATHIAANGAVIGSLSSTQRHAYCYPYYAATLYIPMVAMGYTKEIEHFFALCQRALQIDGHIPAILLSDAAPGPGATSRSDELPIAHDYLASTAAALQLACLYGAAHPRARSTKELYANLIMPAAHALSENGYPHSTPVYVAGMVRAALLQAAAVADRQQDATSAIGWRMTADDITPAPVIATPLHSTVETLRYIQQRFTDGDTAAAQRMLDRVTRRLYTHGCLSASLIDGSRSIDIAAHGEYIRTLLLCYHSRKKGA